MTNEIVMLDDEVEVDFRAINKLSNDIIAASQHMERNEVRYLVDTYYLIQKSRVAAASRVRTCVNKGWPHQVLSYFEKSMRILEGQVKRSLVEYNEHSEIGRWAVSVFGIGPVITAGLQAYIEMEKAPTIGHVFSFAGVAAEGKPWKKGEKRPFCVQFRRLFWIIGESFIKFQNNPKCEYGLFFKIYLEEEIEKNNAGLNKEAALKRVATAKNKEMKKVYESGKFPDSHLISRARRKVSKLFVREFYNKWKEFLDKEKN